MGGVSKGKSNCLSSTSRKHRGARTVSNQVDLTYLPLVLSEEVEHQPYRRTAIARCTYLVHPRMMLLSLRPTVCLGATSVVVDTYGNGNGRIGPTRCAVIDGVLGDRCSRGRVYRTPRAAADSARSALAAALRPALTAAPGGSMVSYFN